jgi:hypothetical protein
MERGAAPRRCASARGTRRDDGPSRCQRRAAHLYRTAACQRPSSARKISSDFSARSGSDSKDAKNGRSAYGLLFILFALTTGGKGYYLGAAYIYLLAAGAVVIDGWLQARPGRMRNLLLATAVSTAVFVPLVLPVLPAADVGWNSLLREEVGWPQFVRTVDAVLTSLPPGQRARAVVFTENYGEAAAINELGRGTGLPTAVSSQNSEWWWGPGNLRATTVVTVAPGPADVTSYAAYLGQLFVSVRAVATQVNPYGARNQEWGGHVYVCTGPRQPWAQIWPHLRRYS